MYLRSGLRNHFLNDLNFLFLKVSQITLENPKCVILRLKKVVPCLSSNQR